MFLLHCHHSCSTLTQSSFRLWKQFQTVLQTCQAKVSLFPFTLSPRSPHPPTWALVEDNELGLRQQNCGGVWILMPTSSCVSICLSYYSMLPWLLLLNYCQCGEIEKKKFFVQNQPFLMRVTYSKIKRQQADVQLRQLKRNISLADCRQIYCWRKDEDTEECRNTMHHYKS